ncbi:aa3-type cytochrome c oxidase subunit IV [Frigidibacter sp. MR17.14]
MAEHHPGSMDITTQEKTFAGFIRFVTWSCVLIVLFLVFLALVNG